MSGIDAEFHVEHFLIPIQEEDQIPGPRSIGETTPALEIIEEPLRPDLSPNLTPTDGAEDFLDEVGAIPSSDRIISSVDVGNPAELEGIEHGERSLRFLGGEPIRISAPESLPEMHQNRLPMQEPQRAA